MSTTTIPVPGQDHVDWTLPSVQQVVETMSVSYPGGIDGYVAKARQLLDPAAQAQQAAHEAAKRNLTLPAHRVDVGVIAEAPSSDAAAALKQQLAVGNKLVGATAFVLVAGGLGERLGAKSLKLSLPIQMVGSFVDSTLLQQQQRFRDDGCFLHHYISWILKHSKSSSAPSPLVIMTSDDTHARTLELLESNAFFGMPRDSIVLVKQTAVPCVSDSTGKLAVDPKDKSLLMKPHGHGDVHRLLLSSGLLSSGDKSSSSLFHERGIKYVVFMQDTNCGATTTVPYTLAAMEHKRWAMGFTCVPRMPGEAIGALVDADRLGVSEQQEDRRVTYCVEYNVLDDMLKREGYPAGDVPAPGTGSPYSPFPGTINTLVLRLDAYTETVARTHGVIAEFINPKYCDPSDKQHSAFKSPARLETLMQDIALELSQARHGPVGAVVFDRRTYFPVKNALQDGVQKWRTMGIDPHNAAQGEAGFFLLQRLVVAPFVAEESVKTWPQASCVAVSPKLQSSSAAASSFAADVTVLGQLPLAVFPIIWTSSVLDHQSAGRMFASAMDGTSNSNIHISRCSALVLRGDNIVIRSLNLDGALVVDATAVAASGCVVVVDFGAQKAVKNGGWRTVAVEGADDKTKAEEALSEAEVMRGFKYESVGTMVVRVPESLAAKQQQGGAIKIVLNEQGEAEFLMTSQL